MSNVTPSPNRGVGPTDSCQGYGHPDFANLLLPIGYTPAFQGKNEGLVLEDPMAPLLLGKTTLTVSLVKVRYG